MMGAKSHSSSAAQTMAYIASWSTRGSAGADRTRHVAAPWLPEVDASNPAGSGTSSVGIPSPSDQRGSALPPDLTPAPSASDGIPSFATPT